MIFPNGAEIRGRGKEDLFPRIKKKGEGKKRGSAICLVTGEKDDDDGSAEKGERKSSPSETGSKKGVIVA